MTIPHTLTEAVDQVLTWLTPAERETFAAQSAADLIDYHFGLGQRIRNDFGMFQGNVDLLADCAAHQVPRALWIDPDDASLVILSAVWARLHH